MREFFNQEIFPILTAYRADKKLKQDVREIVESEINLVKEFSEDPEQNAEILADDVLDKAEASLKDFLKDEIERKKIVEEKARALLLVISATVAITTGGLATNSDRHIFALDTLFIVIAFLYLICAILSTINTLNVAEYFYVLPNDFFDKRSSQIVFRIDKQPTVIKLYKNVNANRLINTRRANHLSSAFVNIRNGIIMIACFFIWSVFMGGASSSEAPKEAIEPTSNLPVTDSLRESEIPQSDGQPVDPNSDSLCLPE